MPESPFMGDLPKERVKIGEKSFSNTGVVYFGPYLVKKKKLHIYIYRERETRLTKALI